MAGHGRRGGGGHAEHGNDERWLLTYADMITLLMCLFMVMWSISSVNTTKLEVLQRSLKEAFSGKILPGGQAIVQPGESAQDSSTRPKTDPAFIQINARQAENKGGHDARLAAAEDREFERLRRRVEEAARDAGVAGQVRTDVTRRGLRIRLLTDRVVFDSGLAQIKPEGARLLDGVARVLRSASGSRPIQIDGHTDSVPLAGGPHADNWGLSSARAAAVVRRFAADGLARARLAAGGFADNKPVASNATAEGRSKNRRVEILLSRKDQR